MNISGENTPFPELAGPVQHLFNIADDLRFVIKNMEGEYIYTNRCWLESNGFRHPDQVLGKTARDLFPAWRSGRYLREDKRVINEGYVYDYEEYLLNSEGELERWRTMKGPWIESGKIKGYVNIGTRLDSKELELRSDHIPHIVREIASSACEPSNIKEVAASLGISRRTLERKFRDTMNMSPQEFRTKCRILRAKKMLRDGKKISQVSELCGFADQSHFSRSFRKTLTISPKQYQLEQRALAKKKKSKKLPL